MNELMHVQFGELEPWGGLNSRTFFSTEKGAQLRASIREHGVQETLLVARVEDADAEMGREGDAEGEHVGPVRYRIVAGERRWRETCGLMEELVEEHREWQNAGNEEECARLVGLMADREMLPVAVLPRERVGAALELNLVENLQREGITPLEEAEGYARMERTVNPETGEHYTHEEIARKIGTGDVGYVRKRLKLRLAPLRLLEAVNRGEVAATVAEMVGRIPDGKMREQITQEILDPTDQDFPLVLEQVRTLVRDRYMRTLKGAGFSLEDESLAPVVCDDAGVRLYGGDCKTCPMRTGNNPDLQEELSVARKGSESGGVRSGRDANVCTNVACFKVKQDAVWMVSRRAAEGRGQKVIDGDAALDLFRGPGGSVRHDAKYVLREAMPSVKESGEMGVSGEVTWEGLCEAHAVPVEALVVARHPVSGKAVQLVVRDVVMAAVKKARRGGGGGEDAGNGATVSGERCDGGDAEDAETRRGGDGERGCEDVVDGDDVPAADEGAGVPPVLGESGATVSGGEVSAAESAKLERARLDVACELMHTKVCERGLGLEEMKALALAALSRAGRGMVWLGAQYGIEVPREDRRSAESLLVVRLGEMLTTKPQWESLLVLVLQADEVNWLGLYARPVHEAMRSAMGIDAESVEAVVRARFGCAGATVSGERCDGGNIDETTADDAEGGDGDDGTGPVPVPAEGAVGPQEGAEEPEAQEEGDRRGLVEVPAGHWSAPVGVPEIEDGDGGKKGRRAKKSQPASVKGKAVPGKKKSAKKVAAKKKGKK